MNISQANEAVFEALFRQAVIDNFYEELDSLPPDDELAKQYTFSPAHELRMKKLFARDVRVEHIRATVKWSKRIAAAVVIVVALLFGSLMLVPQVRAIVYQTIIEWYDKFVSFTSNTPEIDRTNHAPQYIPEGFRETIREDIGSMITIIYTNDDNGVLITFQSSRLANSTAIDNEMMEYEVFPKEGIEYHLFVSTDDSSENTIIWEKSKQRYTIVSIISIDELINMAISVDK